MFCEQIITNGVPTVVDEGECKKFGPKPPEQQPCNQDAICANWHVGPWKPVCLFKLAVVYLLIFRKLFSAINYVVMARKRGK